MTRTKRVIDPTNVIVGRSTVINYLRPIKASSVDKGITNAEIIDKALKEFYDNRKLGSV